MTTVIGVDTHKYQHTAVCVDQVGRSLGELEIETTSCGYEDLLSWAKGFDNDPVFAIEGTGSWGAGLCRYLESEGLKVYEAERPRRRSRRRGKSDSQDALHAARTLLAGSEGVSTPRCGGTRDVLRVLLVAYDAAISARTRLLNQIQSLIASDTTSLKTRIGQGKGEWLAKHINDMRTSKKLSDIEIVTLKVLKEMARGSVELQTNADGYEAQIRKCVVETNPALLEEFGVGSISAGRLLVCDPKRLKSESAFARANGTAPIPASSGKTQRFRLNRGGDRQLNRALHTIAMSRSQYHAESKSYIERKMSEGKTKREAMRCLKRVLSRSLYRQHLAAA